MSGRIPRLGTGPIRFSGNRVGISTTPDASAKLDVSSTTGGLLPPRMTTTQRDNISSPATGLVIYNTSTNLLNVYDGTSWGTVMPTVDTADQGYFVGFSVFPVSLTTQELIGSVNQVLAFQFVLPFRAIIRTITSEVTTSEASSLYAMGIYSIDGNTLLVDSGAISGASSGVKSVTITAVTLEPGVYWFAQTSNATATIIHRSLNVTGLAGIINGGSQEKTILAGNASSSGVLPATLGSLTATTTRLPGVGVFSP